MKTQTAIWSPASPSIPTATAPTCRRLHMPVRCPVIADDGEAAGEDAEDTGAAGFRSHTDRFLWNLLLQDRLLPSRPRRCQTVPYGECLLYPRRRSSTGGRHCRCRHFPNWASARRARARLGERSAARSGDHAVLTHSVRRVLYPKPWLALAPFLITRSTLMARGAYSANLSRWLLGSGSESGSGGSFPLLPMRLRMPS